MVCCYPQEGFNRLVSLPLRYGYLGRSRWGITAKDGDSLVSAVIPFVQGQIRGFGVAHKRGVPSGVVCPDGRRYRELGFWTMRRHSRLIFPRTHSVGRENYDVGPAKAKSGTIGFRATVATRLHGTPKPFRTPSVTPFVTASKPALSTCTFTPSALMPIDVVLVM